MTSEKVVTSTSQGNLTDFLVSEKADATAVRYSVIIVNYNGLDYIGACLDQLLATLSEEVEIIIVDNASTDESIRYILENYPSVTLIANQENSGFGQGNNLGVNCVQGDYLIFLNPDTMVTPGWLEPMIELLESDPKIGMVTPKILLQQKPHLINACGNDIHLTGLTLCRGALDAPDTHQEPSIVSAVSGAAFVMRKSVFYEIGMFDPLLFMYMDDTDLSLRARLAGYYCVYTPNSVIYHDYSLSFGSRKVYFQERNRYIMLLKTLRWRTLLVMLPALLLAEVVSWGFVLLKEPHRFHNKIDAYIDVLRDWQKIMQRRKIAQQVRRVKDRELIGMFTHIIDFEQTGKNFVSRTAHVIFDPPFYLMHKLLKLIVRW